MSPRELQLRALVCLAASANAGAERRRVTDLEGGQPTSFEGRALAPGQRIWSELGGEEFVATGTGRGALVLGSGGSRAAWHRWDQCFFAQALGTADYFVGSIDASRVTLFDYGERRWRRFEVA